MLNRKFNIVNGLPVLVSFLITFVLFVAAIHPWLSFWNKAAPVFGSFAAIYGASLEVACKTESNKRTFEHVPLNHIPLWFVFVAFVCAETNLILSVVCSAFFKRANFPNKKIEITAYIIAYCLFYIFFFELVVDLRLLLPKIK